MRKKYLRQMDNNSVKENISKLRRRLGLSQEAMAEKMGISRTAYRNIEAGKTRLMSENIDKIASILGISAEELMLGYRPEEGGSREFSDMKAQYGTKIKEIENGYEEEIRQLKAHISVLNDLIVTLKETVRTKEEVITMLRKTISENAMK